MESTAHILVVGGVEVLNRLGAGGMGEVYLGHHQATGMKVAVKLLKEGATAKERFLNEARLGLGLADPHLVRVYNAGEDQGRLYIIMEVLPGGTVRDRLREGRMPWDRATDLLLEAAKGLAALHRAGVIHRDIKPSNMMFAADGTLRLTDFGLARRFADAGIVTRSSDRLGSPAYIAPEQVLDASEADARSDVYSLGISYYEMLTGTPPFRTPSDTDVCFQQVHRPLPDIRAAVPDLPRKLVSLLQRMTSKNPLQRPADGSAVVEELQRLHGSGTVATVNIRRPRRRTVVWAALVAAACALVLPGFVVFNRAKPSSWQSPERAVFVLPAGLDAATTHAIQAGLERTGLNVVERDEIGRVLAGPDFTAADLMNPGTAVRVGHMVGGHLALFARSLDGLVNLRAVEVETTLLRGSDLVAPADAGAQAEHLVTTVMHRLPAQGVVQSTDHGTCRISLGRRHGLVVGDRFQLYDGLAERRGARLATGTVRDLDATTAVLTVDGESVPVNALAERIAAP
ncbi:MAG TPA: serine/threonine-protein kinase [Planctomycetota bacterium]|nr:serine/threonine-protein kinase [Planctomycetota bacterium]